MDTSIIFKSTYGFISRFLFYNQRACKWSVSTQKLARWRNLTSTALNLETFKPNFISRKHQREPLPYKTLLTSKVTPNRFSSRRLNNLPKSASGRAPNSRCHSSSSPAIVLVPLVSSRSPKSFNYPRQAGREIFRVETSVDKGRRSWKHQRNTGAKERKREKRRRDESKRQSQTRERGINRERERESEKGFSEGIRKDAERWHGTPMSTSVSVQVLRCWPRDNGLGLVRTKGGLWPQLATLVRYGLSFVIPGRAVVIHRTR